MGEKKRGSTYNSANWKDFLDEAQKRRDKKEISKAYRKDFRKFMRKYAEEHKTELDIRYQYYTDAKSDVFNESCYELLDSKKMRTVLSKCKVMILTANPIEKAVFHYMMFKESNRKIERIICDNIAYFILKWDKYWVAHVHQIETGAHKNWGANTTIYEALKYFTPNVIISLGVAFGIDYTSQNIGDVIVSKRLLPYSENKRDEEKVKPDRSQDKVIDYWLQVRLANVNGFLNGVTYGDVMTGGSVMSSFDEKDKICSGYTAADFVVGGEMEGDALFQYARIANIPGVVIKGICDWGVAKNDIFPEDKEREEKFKDSLQAFAMVKAIEKSKPLFHDKQVFATPKNRDYIELQYKYNSYKIRFITSQLVTIVYCLVLFTAKYDFADNIQSVFTYSSFDLKFLLVLISIDIIMAIWGWWKLHKLKLTKKENRCWKYGRTRKE